MGGEPRHPGVIVRMDPEDRALLDATSRAEKLSMSDVLRRALRAYAANLGIKVPKPKK